MLGTRLSSEWKTAESHRIPPQGILSAINTSVYLKIREGGEGGVLGGRWSWMSSLQLIAPVSWQPIVAMFWLGNSLMDGTAAAIF